MVVEFHLGETLRLRKPHPCGDDRWQVVRLGADIGLRCLGCHRRILIERRTLERRVKDRLNASGKVDSTPNIS